MQLWTDFDAFKEAVLNASLTADAELLSVDYASPSQGRLVMGWDGPLTQNSTPIEIGDFPRYENPYSSSAFPGDVISFGHAGQSLKLDYAKQSRDVSCFVD